MRVDRSLITFARADSHRLAPVPWLIRDWLVADTLAGLVGASGACKSFLAIDWACRVATGAPWAGHEVKQGAVFVLAGEGRTGLSKRIAGWTRATGISIERAPLFLADGLPALADAGNVGEVLEAVQVAAEEAFYLGGHEPALIIVDTVARALAGFNENTSEDMGRFVQGLDRLRQAWGACVLTIHHTGHGSETQDRARGSSAYRAALDSEFVIKPDASTVTIRATKAKDWACPPAVTLAKQSVGIDTPAGAETTLVLEERSVLPPMRERVRELHNQGVQPLAIAERLQVSKSSVYRWLDQSRVA